MNPAAQATSRDALEFAKVFVLLILGAVIVFAVAQAAAATLAFVFLGTVRYLLQ